MQEIIYSFLLSIILSTILIHIFSRLFYSLNILDKPKKYNKKRKPIPYSMGVIFFFSFFFVSFFFVEYDYKLWLIWVFWLFITWISFIDDLLNISPKIRLLFQIIIWFIIWITSIKIWYISNIFGWIINLETYYFQIYDLTIYIIPLIFTIIWYVFVFNALNWSDWIEWNTSGISIISFFILFLLGVMLFNKDEYGWGVKNAQFIMHISIILVWILIPFWYFDIKEKILMWDSWTMFLGFMLATLAIISGWKIATVLVVFWIYAVDAIYVLLLRVFRRKSIFSWDFTHIHHRLLKIGLNKKEVLILLYSLSFFFWLTALFLDKIWKIIVFLIIICIVIFINKIVEVIKK